MRIHCWLYTNDNTKTHSLTNPPCFEGKYTIDALCRSRFDPTALRTTRPDLRIYVWAASLKGIGANRRKSHCGVFRLVYALRGLMGHVPTEPTVLYIGKRLTGYIHRRYMMIGSAALSLLGAGVIFLSAFRFRELSKRFFAIRLILFLTITDAVSAIIHIFGGVQNLEEVARGDTTISIICKFQAIGLIYFDTASILWTSCFAFTLYRDIMR